MQVGLKRAVVSLRMQTRTCSLGWGRSARTFLLAVVRASRKRITDADVLTVRSALTAFTDESMQPWLGPAWREDSLIREREWARKLSEERGVHVWVMTSWTKIWSCTGVRLGSVVAPTRALRDAVKAKQVSAAAAAVAAVRLMSKPQALSNVRRCDRKCSAQCSAVCSDHVYRRATGVGRCAHPHLA